MTERPIIFNAKMVRAILNKQKTQTRRPAKYIPDLGYPKNWCHRIGDHDFERFFGGYRQYCPHGQPGDMLWVRETWQVYDYCSGEYGGIGEAGYPLTGSMKDKPAFGGYCIYYAADMISDGPWRPSIHMPRWASRIVLEITDVRVERVQDISDEDAAAEGAWLIEEEQALYRRKWGDEKKARYEFADLWDSIYSDTEYSWDANPWVWVIEFQRCE